MGRTTTRRLTLSATAALAVAIGLGAAASAWAKGPGGHHGHGARLERAIEGLELEPAKRAELFGVIDAARPAERELRDRMRAAHEEMRALLDGNAAEEAVLAKADELGELQTEHRKHELRTLLQVRARLSAEQQAQLATALSERHCSGRHERRRVL